MPDADPTRLDALLRGIVPQQTNHPQGVDNPVDGASTAGDGPTRISLPDMGFPGAVDDANPDAPARDEDGLDVAWQVMDRLGGARPPVEHRRRRRPVDDRRPSRDAGDLTPIGGVLDDFVDARGWHTQVGLRMLLSSWPQLVGEANAEHCHPDGLHDGVLTVRADSTAWASALRFIAPQVVAALNERLGQGTVTRIAVVGPSAPSWKHGPRSISDARGPRDTYG